MQQDPKREPNYPESPLAGDQGSPTVFGAQHPLGEDETLQAHSTPSETAGHAEPVSSLRAQNGTSPSDGSHAKKTGDVTAILEEIELKRRLNQQKASSDANPSDFTEREQVSADTGRTQQRNTAVSKAKTGQAAKSPAHKSGTKQASSQRTKNGTSSKAHQGKRKKKKKRQPLIVQILRYIFPWRGDSILESVRKIIFVAALTAVGICGYFIGDYYYMLYRSNKEYDAIRARLDETLSNRGFSEDSYVTDPETGQVIEYLEQNELADRLLGLNPDLVGYITIDGTEISYPVAQKKSNDPNINTNDYYLYRSFNQESSDAGCIFMDFRCHFDEVVNHRRAVENSDNLIIYGHNMNNRSMFGSLKDYMRNYSFLQEHPTVHLQSLYKSYVYKIFAVFIVDSSDTDSPYSFDCWNTLDFDSEDEFYEFVNQAKKRTIIANDVDVQYGDPLLTLYTCNSTVSNGKLIVMARLQRPGEDPNEGVENAGLNDNILWPKSYYNNHDLTFDPNLFVPYGPKEENDSE